MKKVLKKNQKGSVLLTVLCFTTVCLIIATMALTVANYSTKVSNNNVRKTQAQITAEDYLEAYINQLTDYDELKTLAGQTITCELLDSSGNAVDASQYGGTCKITVSKSEGAYIVRADATYAGETGTVSAYFSGSSSQPYESNNVIETNGTYDVTEASPVNGDILLENKNKTAITYFYNSNGAYKSNVYTNANLRLGDGTTPQTFKDTTEKNAPTITAIGNIICRKIVMTTDYGKTDINGNKYLTDAGERNYDYDSDNLLNKNGYINTFSKIVFTDGNTIGDTTNDIDVYCRGAFIGAVPQEYGTVDNKSFYKDLTDNYGYAGSTNGNGTVMHGNLYCKKIDEKNVATDGALVLNADGDQTIDGDVVVEGNIYVIGSNNCRLVVTGTLYCSGKIYDASNNEYTVNNVPSKLVSAGKVSTTLPSDERSEQPLEDYAPGLYVYGVTDNPTISMPSEKYAGESTAASPNNMYSEDAKSNYNDGTTTLKDLYTNALSRSVGEGGTYETKESDGTKVEKPIATYNGSNYVISNESDELKSGNIVINTSCKLTQTQASGSSAYVYKLTVKVTNEDIVILLPISSSSGSGGLGTGITIDNSENTDGHFVYFMFYDSDSTSNNYYTQTNTGKSYTLGTQSNIQGWYVCESTYGSINTKTTPSQSNPSTNILWLIPDGFEVRLGGGNGAQWIEGIIYGPNAKFVYPSNTGCKIYGQIKVEEYAVDANQSYSFIERMDPKSGSVLGFIDEKSDPDDDSLKFGYYVKSVS